MICYAAGWAEEQVLGARSAIVARIVKSNKVRWTCCGSDYSTIYFEDLNVAFCCRGLLARYEYDARGLH